MRELSHGNAPKKPPGTHESLHTGGSVSQSLHTARASLNTGGARRPPARLPLEDRSRRLALLHLRVHLAPARGPPAELVRARQPWAAPLSAPGFERGFARSSELKKVATPSIPDETGSERAAGRAPAIVRRVRRYEVSRMNCPRMRSRGCRLRTKGRSSDLEPVTKPFRNPRRAGSLRKTALCGGMQQVGSAPRRSVGPQVRPARRVQLVRGGTRRVQLVRGGWRDVSS